MWSTSSPWRLRQRIERTFVPITDMHSLARQDGCGNPYCWNAYLRQGGMKAPDGTDLATLNEGFIAVTPLKLDMTDKPFMTRLARLFE